VWQLQGTIQQIYEIKKKNLGREEGLGFSARSHQRSAGCW
jgi:hypothetical protein